jgi:hypothetical protein
MSFAKSRAIYSDLAGLLESRRHESPNWFNSREYETLFKAVWNNGKEFFSRCATGKMPSQRDFDLFYQEGIFRDLYFCYKGKEIKRENTPGFHLKQRMIETFGTAYPMSQEDLDVIAEKTHLLFAWIPAGGDLKVLFLDRMTL